jgi:hypothetical protein
LLAGDDHFPTLADDGQRFGEVVGKLDRDGPPERPMEVCGELAIIPLPIAFDSRASQFLGQRVHHHEYDRFRPPLPSRLGRLAGGTAHPQ